VKPEEYNIGIQAYNNCRRIRCAWHVLSMGEMRNTYIILVGKSEGNIHLGDVDLDGSLISKWILNK
jgi:hypothetical protein